jgi:outer membrane protein OmpA-like peptidoglycan-associated protein
MSLKTRLKIVLPTLAVGIVTGCGGLPKSQSLLQAEQAYADAKSDTEVLRHASSELARAEQALNRARSAEESAVMDTYAYVSERRTGVARAATEKRMGQEELNRLSRERDQVQLEIREMETANARAQREEALREREFALAEREQAVAEARKLQEELAALQAEKTARGMVMTLGDVLFATAKADLLPGAMDTIQRLSAFMGQYPEKTLLIEGHTDSVGSDEYNQGLSERRAMAVKVALEGHGVDPMRISTQGFGKTRPIADNGSDAGRLKNRRVEIVIRD